MKKIVFIVFCLLPMSNFAKTKGIKKIAIKNTTVQNVVGSRSKVNEMYCITLKILQNNIQLDSAWFGGLPVPIDVYRKNSRLKSGAILEKNEILTIKANKKLYENYPQIDTTNLHQQFSAPFPFSGKLILFYHFNGEKNYEIIKKVKQLPSLGLRE